MLRSFKNLLSVKRFDQQQKRLVALIEIFINGKSVYVPSYYTIIQALRQEQVTVPNFCYHERLAIVGNCRMCLVEVEGWWKPQIACAVPVAKGMRVRTNSEVTYKAQEGILEFILADHPLDCPICDQGGECDLQDLSFRFGSDRSRFTDIHFEGKRAVENKNLSPLVRSEMTRCIHCTRCIRFSSQVCGMDVIGTTGRSHDMLVGMYVNKLFLSELSGCVIDLCPVGALTSIPYIFKARPWELRRTNSIDVTDACGTNIVLNHRGNKLLRVLPRENPEVNQEWLSDKGRWAIDSLQMQRLVTPMIRSQELEPVEWECALEYVANKINALENKANIIVIAGPHSNIQTLVVVKDLFNQLGCENLYVERDLCHVKSGIDIRAAYSLNVNMKDVATSDMIFLIGTNPRFEAPILNAWIRNAYVNNDCDIYVLGPKCEYNYAVKYLGDEPSSFKEIPCILKGAKRPLIFVGVDQLAKPYAGSLAAELLILAKPWLEKNWNAFHVITQEASFAGALEGGWRVGGRSMLKCCNPELVISLGADEIFYEWSPTCAELFYVGFQGDRGAEVAKVILPGCAYTETSGSYMNMECRNQIAMGAITPPGKARTDWKIFRALAEYLGVALPYSDECSLLNRMEQISPNFVYYAGDYQGKCFAEVLDRLPNDQCDKMQGRIDVGMKNMEDYYCHDVFSYNSPTMVKTKKAAENFVGNAYAVI